jgi:hypothetical protein
LGTRWAERIEFFENVEARESGRVDDLVEFARDLPGAVDQTWVGAEVNEPARYRARANEAEHTGDADASLHWKTAQQRTVEGDMARRGLDRRRRLLSVHFLLCR